MTSRPLSPDGLRRPSRATVSAKARVSRWRARRLLFTPVKSVLSRSEPAAWPRLAVPACAGRPGGRRVGVRLAACSVSPPAAAAPTASHSAQRAEQRRERRLPSPQRTARSTVRRAIPQVTLLVPFAQGPVHLQFLPNHERAQLRHAVSSGGARRATPGRGPLLDHLEEDPFAELYLSVFLLGLRVLE